MKIQEDNERLA